MTRPGGRLRATRQAPVPAAEPTPAVAQQAMTHLAASWYVALPSIRVGTKPRALTMFGRELVAWRDGTGQASVLPRHCPHLGASLALGKVVEGELRCVFHHWRFDATGACVHVPRLENLPSHMTRRRAYPVLERYGFLWIWYGSREPLFPLPELPRQVMNRGDYQRHMFALTTSASPRRVLEQAFDYHRFTAGHDVAADGPHYSTGADPGAAGCDDPPIVAEAWTGARLRFHGSQLPESLRSAVPDRPTDLLVDCWPGGQRLTFSVAGKDVVRELVAVTPVRDGHTIVRGWSFVRRSGDPVQDMSRTFGYRRFRRRDLRQVLRAYADFRAEQDSVPTAQDAPLAHFRERYEHWVHRAQHDGEAGVEQ